MIATNLHDPHKMGESERRIWNCVGKLLFFAGLWMSLVFWSSLASKWYDLPAHWTVALITHLAVFGGTYSLVMGIMGKNGGKVWVGILALSIAIGLNILNGVGFHANSQMVIASEQAQAARGEGLTDSHLATLQARVASLKGDVDAPRAVQLRSEVDRLTTDKAALEPQRADFARRNVITAGVKTTQAKIDALSAQIEAKTREANQAKAETHGMRSSELAAAQAELDSVERSKVRDEISAPANYGGAGKAFFVVMSKLTGASIEECSSRFFLLLPVTHELFSFAGAFLMAMSRLKRASSLPVSEQEQESSPAPVPPPVYQVAPITPAPQPQHSNNSAAPPRAAPVAIDQPGAVAVAPTVGDYITQLFESWPPSHE